MFTKPMGWRSGDLYCTHTHPWGEGTSTTSFSLFSRRCLPKQLQPLHSLYSSWFTFSQHLDFRDSSVVFHVSMLRSHPLRLRDPLGTSLRELEVFLMTPAVMKPECSDSQSAEMMRANPFRTASLITFTKKRTKTDLMKHLEGERSSLLEKNGASFNTIISTLLKNLRADPMPWRPVDPPHLWQRHRGNKWWKHPRRNNKKIPNQVWNRVPLPKNALVQPGKGRRCIQLLFDADLQGLTCMISFNPRDSVMRDPVPFCREEMEPGKKALRKITAPATGGTVPVHVRDPHGGTGQKGVVTWALPDAAQATRGPKFSTAGNVQGRSFY